MIYAETPSVTAALYVCAVTFFALWRLERSRRIEFVRLVREEVARQENTLRTVTIDLEDFERVL